MWSVRSAGKYNMSSSRYLFPESPCGLLTTFQNVCCSQVLSSFILSLAIGSEWRYSMAFAGLRVSVGCAYPYRDCGGLHTFTPQRTFVAQDVNLIAEVL